MEARGVGIMDFRWETWNEGAMRQSSSNVTSFSCFRIFKGPMYQGLSFRRLGVEGSS